MTWDDVRINKNPESLKIHEVQQELKTRRDTLWWNCRTQKTLPLPCPLAEDWTQFLSNKTQWPRKVRKIIAGQIQRRYRIGKSGDVLIGGAGLTCKTEGTQCSSSSSACVSALGDACSQGSSPTAELEKMNSFLERHRNKLWVISVTITTMNNP